MPFCCFRGPLHTLFGMRKQHLLIHTGCSCRRASVTQKQPGTWITCGMSAYTQSDRVELCFFVSNVSFIGVFLLLCLLLTCRNGFGGSTWLWHLRWRFIARVARMGYNVMSLDRWDPRMSGTLGRPPRMGTTLGGTLGCSQSRSSGVHAVASCSVQGPFLVLPHHNWGTS